MSIFSKWTAFMNPERRLLFADLGLLVLRVSFGLSMALAHGLGKLQGYSTMSEKFPDPLHVGSAASLAMVVFAEFFCSLALVLGLFTRFALVTLVINMSVAFFWAHSADPFGKKEPAFVYLMIYVALLIAGPGRFSADGVIAKKLGSQGT